MADILVAPASGMPNAPTGQVTLFLDTENNNILSYINDQGVVFIYNFSTSPSALEECCSCDIAKKLVDSVTCALNSGFITATEFNTIIANGFSVTTNEVVNPSTGAKTCTVEVGPKTPVPISLILSSNNGNVFANMGASSTLQVTATVLPSNANQGVTWISSNTAILTVSSTGLVTSSATLGTATITAVSQGNPSVNDVITITVV